jgi:hypothetical protein
MEIRCKIRHYRTPPSVCIRRFPMVASNVCFNNPWRLSYAKRLSAFPLPCLQKGIPNGDYALGQSAAKFGADRLSTLWPGVPALRPPVPEGTGPSCYRPVAPRMPVQSLSPNLLPLARTRGEVSPFARRSVGAFGTGVFTACGKTYQHCYSERSEESRSALKI